MMFKINELALHETKGIHPKNSVKHKEPQKNGLYIQ